MSVERQLGEATQSANKNGNKPSNPNKNAPIKGRFLLDVYLLVNPAFAGDSPLNGFVSAFDKPKNPDFKVCQSASNVG